MAQTLSGQLKLLKITPDNFLFAAIHEATANYRPPLAIY
jgi:hypothetical protein